MTRHQQLMERLIAFYKPPFSKDRLAIVLKASASIIIDDLDSSPEEIEQMIAGQMLKFRSVEQGLETTEQALEYAHCLFDVIFMDMYEGNRAKFKSHLDDFAGSCFEALIGMGEEVVRLGRPVRRRGTYGMITIEIREDLLLKLDRQPESRRKIIEDLLLADSRFR